MSYLISSSFKINILNSPLYFIFLKKILSPYKKRFFYLKIKFGQVKGIIFQNKGTSRVIIQKKQCLEAFIKSYTYLISIKRF